MPDIKDTVNGSGSQVQDIAMVQMMLKVIKDAKGIPYLKTNYSGTWSDDTKDAIVRFQNDQKLIGGKASETSGAVGAHSETFRKLNQLLPAQYKDAMILPGARTVYFPGSAKDAASSASHISSNQDLDMKFRLKAGQFVNEFYDQTKIVLKNTDSGLRRDFKSQMTVTSQAGPGESNHQFGQAADIGFQGLRWVDGDGTIRTDTAWLNAGETKATKAHMSGAKAQEFWKAHHALAFGKVGLFKTNLAGDDIHVQAYPDSSVSYARSMARLLNLTSASKWEPAGRDAAKHNVYESDFALGGKRFTVGTAKQIFGGNAAIRKDDVVAALAATKKDLSKLDVFKEFQVVKSVKVVPGKLPTPFDPTKLTTKDITEADLELLRKAAQKDWVKADQNWKQWTPVP
jgi:hypothetical protein